MTDKGKERIQRGCQHVTLKRIQYSDGEYSEFSRCEDCTAIFLTNRVVGLAAANPVEIFLEQFDTFGAP